MQPGVSIHEICRRDGHAIRDVAVVADFLNAEVRMLLLPPPPPPPVQEDKVFAYLFTREYWGGGRELGRETVGAASTNLHLEYGKPNG